MNCADAKLILVDLLYGELNAAEATSAREHLAECASCRQELARLESSREQLNRVTERPVRIDLARLCLRGAEQWERSRRRWRRIGYAAAAAVILIGIFVARQVRFEVQDGQMLIAWRHVPPQNVQPLPTSLENPPSQQMASVDYLRLRTRILNQGTDIANAPDVFIDEPTNSPRSYRALRDQLLSPNQ